MVDLAEIVAKNGGSAQAPTIEEGNSGSSNEGGSGNEGGEGGNEGGNGSEGSEGKPAGTVTDTPLSGAG